jgi:hypothetical protein
VTLDLENNLNFPTEYKGVRIFYDVVGEIKTFSL